MNDKRKMGERHPAPSRVEEARRTSATAARTGAGVRGTMPICLGGRGREGVARARQGLWGESSCRGCDQERSPRLSRMQAQRPGAGGAAQTGKPQNAAFAAQGAEQGGKKAREAGVENPHGGALALRTSRIRVNEQMRFKSTHPSSVSPTRSSMKLRRGRAGAGREGGPVKCLPHNRIRSRGEKEPPGKAPRRTGPEGGSSR